MFGRVVVQLDSQAPVHGAFVHALLWARRCGAALVGVTLSAGAERDRACAALCTRHGVAWEALACADLEQGLPKLLRPSDLLVFGSALSPARMRSLSNRSRAAVLICPETSVPVSRVLVVDGPGASDGLYLSVAAELCRTLRAGLVVLSIGASQHEADQRRQQAQSALLNQEPAADFDVMIGPEVRKALAHVARWRHCQMVITRQLRPSFWRGWLGGRASGDWLEPAGSLLHLVVPAEVVPQTKETPPPAIAKPREVAHRCG